MKRLLALILLMALVLGMTVTVSAETRSTFISNAEAAELNGDQNAEAADSYDFLFGTSSGIVYDYEHAFRLRELLKEVDGSPNRLSDYISDYDKFVVPVLVDGKFDSFVILEKEEKGYTIIMSSSGKYDTVLYEFITKTGKEFFDSHPDCVIVSRSDFGVVAFVLPAQNAEDEIYIDFDRVYNDNQSGITSEKVLSYCEAGPDVVARRAEEWEKYKASYTGEPIQGSEDDDWADDQPIVDYDSDGIPADQIIPETAVNTPDSVPAPSYDLSSERPTEDPVQGSDNPNTGVMLVTMPLATLVTAVMISKKRR